MARKIAIPEEVDNKCRQYCKSRKFKEGTFLRLLILNKVPSLHDAATLNKIVERTHIGTDSNMKCTYRNLFFSEETMKEIDKYSAFFKLGRKKCNFLYYLIEDDLKKILEES